MWTLFVYRAECDIASNFYGGCTVEGSSSKIEERKPWLNLNTPSQIVEWNTRPVKSRARQSGMVPIFLMRARSVVQTASRPSNAAVQ